MMNPPAQSADQPDARLMSVPTGLAWAFWAFASSLPWLLPTHSAPWTTIYQELLIAGLILPIAVWAMWFRNGRWQVDALAAGFLAAAFVPILQSAYGMFSLPAESPLVSHYLTGFALTSIIARRAEEIAPGRLIDAMLAGFVIAALFSTGIALYQWLGLDSLGVLLASNPPGDRPVANVGQPNNLASLLVWGLVAIWWAYLRRRISGATAMFAAAFMLVGVALTQSRAGVLEVLVICVAAFVCRRVLRTAGHWPAWLALVLWFAACLIALDPLSRHLVGEPTRSLVDAASPQERAMLLKLVLTSIGERPWFGYGWNQNVTAHVEHAAQFPMHGTVGNAHNLILDLVLWNGVPLGVVMVVGLCAWLWWAARDSDTAEQRLLIVGVATFSLHAMLELPHVFACFLVPVAVMVGTLNAHRKKSDLFTLPRTVIGAAIVLHGLVLMSMFSEYGRIEANATAARMRAANIAGAPPETDPRVFVLQSLQDGLLTLRAEPRRNMGADELEHMRRAVTRYPTKSGLFRYANAAALNGRPQEATRALRVLCSLHPVESCREAGQGWAQLIETGFLEASEVQLPVEAAPIPSR